MSEAAPAPVLAVCGLAREARIASGPGVDAIQAGGRPERLRSLLASRAGASYRAVISFGIAGGLAPDLRPGDLVIGSGVVCGSRIEAAPAVVTRYAESLTRHASRVRVADLAGVDAAVLTPAAKADLHARTEAAAVDMESHVAAAYAQAHGLPFCAIRVICDPAERAIPAFAAAALKPNGEPDALSVLRALASGRARPGDVIRLARDSNAAFASLSRARALLGLALGVDA